MKCFEFQHALYSDNGVEYNRIDNKRAEQNTLRSNKIQIEYTKMEQNGTEQNRYRIKENRM